MALILADVMTDRTPHEDGTVSPPGSVLVKSPDGSQFQVELIALDKKPLPESELTDGQIERIKRFRETLADAHPAPIEEVLSDFRKDDNPEEEIRVWEEIAALFQNEVRIGSITDPALKRLLLGVLLACSWSPSVDDILADLPTAKTLPDLDGIVQRFVAAQQDAPDNEQQPTVG